MHLGIVTDEVNMDFERAIELCTMWGVKRFEIRQAWGKRFPNFDRDELNEIKEIRDNYGIEITSVSPGIFKTTLSSENLDYHKTSLLQNSLAMAEELEVKKIIIFGIQRSPDDTEEDITRVIDILGEATLKAKSRGFQLLVENEPGWWADTSKNTYKVLDSLRDTGLKLNWDPGNLFNAGEEDYKKGYELLKEFIGHVHVKDVKKTDNENIYVPVGQGDIDWAGQLRDLKADGYSENIIVETHLSPKEESSKISVEYVKKIIG